ncbi:hypothetical protein [Neobacillus drentensis]
MRKAVDEFVLKKNTANVTILPKTGSFADTNMLVGLGLIISTIVIG